MGAGQSAVVESLPLYCAEEGKKSKQCMYKYDYDRYGETAPEVLGKNTEFLALRNFKNTKIAKHAG